MASTLLLIGAGDAALSVLRSMSRFYPRVDSVICLDDDAVKIGTQRFDTPVQGPIDAYLDALTSPLDVLIAMPSSSKKRIKEIYKRLQTRGCTHIDIVPSSSRIVEGDVHPSDIRPISPVDIIGRDYTPLNIESCREHYSGERVMITGAGGSIGTELSRQLLWLAPRELILLDHSEDHLHSAYAELSTLQREGVGRTTTLTPLIADLRQAHELRSALEKTRPSALIHTAAYKHVYLMEQHPYQAMLNNVVGTYHLLHNALAMGLSHFIHISTDKVVNPKGVYGFSKLVAEWIALNFSAHIKGTTVRFGNVLGSRGSLLPILEKSIPKRRIHITSAQAERYFMSASEAASLILKTLSKSDPQHLYLLDMGDALSIMTLAEEVIDYYGLKAQSDVHIEITGLRPEEKEREELVYSYERLQPTDIPRVLAVTGSKAPPMAEIESCLEEFLALDAPDLDKHAQSLLASFVQKWLYAVS